MQLKQIVTDATLLEQIEYPFNTLPVLYYQDCLDEYLNGEIGYHWHHDFEIFLVLKGEIEHTVINNENNKEVCFLKQGDGIFVNPKTLHKLKQKQPGTIILGILIQINFFDALSMKNVYAKDVLPLINSSLAISVLSKQNNQERKILDYVRKITAVPKEDELYCLELLCRLWRHLFVLLLPLTKTDKQLPSEHIQEKRVRLMVTFIHDNYFNNITIDDIASFAKISRSECFRCFSSVIQKTPQQYLNEYRLTRAAKLLINTDQKIIDICFSCGFNSFSYFGKLFKKISGKTPQEYRNFYRN